MLLEEIELSDKVDRKFTKALEVLMSGKQLYLPLEKCQMALAKTQNGSLQSVFVMKSGRVIGMDFSFSALYEMIQTVSEDDITIGIAEIALNRMKSKERTLQMI